MSISRDYVRHVAHLARLELSQEEEKLYAEQLSKIIAHVNKLQELNTDTVEAMSHVLPIANVFREDEKMPGLAREEALGNAPDSDGRFFKVPKVMP